MTIGPIAQLGRNIERAWAAADFDLEMFPRLCADQLDSARLHELISPEDVIAAVFAGDLPQQCDPEARFGQPPVTLFRTPRFFIDVLFWVDGTTTVHDHSFSGAFQVLVGESIEASFEFQRRREVSAHLRLGALSVTGSTLRRAGDIRAVPAGPVFIHSLFHLARPSISLVVRTYKDPPGEQFNYSRPGMAFDPFVRDPLRDRKIQVVEMLRKTESDQFESRVGDLIAAADADTAFCIVRSCMKVQDVSMVDRLVARIDDAEVRANVAQWVGERRRAEFLITRRAVVHDPDLRFLLAVLLNSTRLVDVLGLVGRFASSADPARKVAAWLHRLSTTTMRLQVGHSPFEPNVLGLPRFEAGFEEGLAEFLAGRDAPTERGIQAFIDRLRTLPALHPLFERDSDGRH